MNELWIYSKLHIQDVITYNFCRYNMVSSKLVGSCVNGIWLSMEMSMSDVDTEDLAHVYALLSVNCYIKI